MATYALHKGQVVFEMTDDQDGKGLAMFGRLPIRPPPVRPGGAGRPGGTGTGAGAGAGRPRGAGSGRPGGAGAGRPGRGRGGGGSWPGRALAVAVGAGLVKIWSFKWYILGGFGVYVIFRTVKGFMRRNTNDNFATLAAPHFCTESADASAVLAGYVKEVLQRKDLDDLDVCTVMTSFGSLSETKDKSRSCILSKNGQAIGVFVTQESSKFGCWDCCNGNIQDAAIVAKGYDKLSYMAARRLSDESAVLFDTISDGPEFVIIACDGVCNLMENMKAVRFVYQAARVDMELRPLCDVLLDGLLSSGSSVKMVAVLVQFKARHLGEGSFVNV